VPRAVFLILELAPKDVAPHTDTGLTAYRAAKKVSRHLLPGEYVVVIGRRWARSYRRSGSRGPCAAEIIVVDRSDKSLELAKECGAYHLVKADADEHGNVSKVAIRQLCSADLALFPERKTP
jgi:NAD+-dependent secondary alcohol dehydrogenase Adh1